jgi:hypothetical protein
VLAGLRAAGRAGPSAIYKLPLALATTNILSHHGWFVPPPNTGAYRADYRLRAVVAVYGLAANRPAEALYIIGAADHTHVLLGTTHGCVIRFAAGQLPPARYFWSLTMRNRNFFLVPNPIHRYSPALTPRR